MAERIADPIRQLTRATGRIARGDFDARIAVRLVGRAAAARRRLQQHGRRAEARSAIELERTHRLEAWAEMARQVAHEIKNPLTPIQLSAEHLRRVHADRGEPLGPVLEGCVDLDPRAGAPAAADRRRVLQLRLVADGAPRAGAIPSQLVDDVVEPYRVGLDGRIALDERVAAPLPPVLRRSHARRRARSPTSSRTRCTRCPAAARCGSTSRVRRTSAWRSGSRTPASAWTRRRSARVFEPYFSTKTTGTGLGLPIARRNIELSGGSIASTSEKDAARR